MLTRQQSRLLFFISAHIQQNRGVGPSYVEMADAMGLKSKSGVNRLLSGLVERGFIDQMPRRARALEIVRMPGDVDQVADFRRAAEALEAAHGTGACVDAMTDLIRDMLAKDERELLSRRGLGRMTAGRA